MEHPGTSNNEIFKNNLNKNKVVSAQYIEDILVGRGVCGISSIYQRHFGR